MPANALVQTRINSAVKEEAAAVLATMGLTVSDAVRLMLTRVAHDKALPFEPLTPNAETIKAMQEARAEKRTAMAVLEAQLRDGIASQATPWTNADVERLRAIAANAP